MTVVDQEVKKFLLMAKEFKNGAIVCLERGLLRSGAYLAVFSIELYLKSFLFLKYAPVKKEMVYKTLKKFNHNVENILKECCSCDGNFRDLTTIVSKYSKYSSLRYPDELDNIIYEKGGVNINSNEFINDLKKIEEFIIAFIPRKISRSIR